MVIKKVLPVIVAATVVSLAPSTASAVSATYKVSVDVADKCSLEVRSAHLGVIEKDSEALATEVQSSTASNVKIQCGGLTIDVGAILANPVTAAATLGTLATDLQDVVAAINASYPITFTSATGGKFTDDGTAGGNGFDYLMYVDTGGVASDLAGLTAALSGLPSGFDTTACTARSATFSPITFGTGIDVTGGLPLSTTTFQDAADGGDTTAQTAIAVPVVGATLANLPYTITAGASVIDFCYEVKTVDVNPAAITISDTANAPNYPNGFQANDGGDPVGKYFDTITVDVAL